MLVPILVGIDPGIALVSSGLGTLVYLFTTKGKIPAYLGSSFAFIAAMQLLMKTDGYPAIAQGAVTTGLVYLIVALIIKRSVQHGWIKSCLQSSSVQSSWLSGWDLRQMQQQMLCIIRARMISSILL